jgi:protein ECT2
VTINYSIVHQFGLFEFKTGRGSRPGTPTARSKASIFGLDAISRNLFNSRPASMGEFFGGSINSRKSKSTVSRSSVYTHTTGDSLLRFSRSNSTASAATTVDDDASFFSSSPKSKKLLRRGRSPLSEAGRQSPSRSTSRTRSHSREHHRDESDEDEDEVLLQNLQHLNPSERNLALQLALARRNSKNQGERKPIHSEAPAEDTIYEG